MSTTVGVTSIHRDVEEECLVASDFLEEHGFTQAANVLRAAVKEQQSKKVNLSVRSDMTYQITNYHPDMGGSFPMPSTPLDKAFNGGESVLKGITRK